MKNGFLAIFAAATLLTLSCSKDQPAADKLIIEKYLKDNNLTAQTTDEGVYYIIDTEGTGVDFPTKASTVEMYYKGYFTSGQVFDQSLAPNSPLVSKLFNLVTGWQIGVPKFKKNSKGRLFIPSALGYGSQATGSIPANSVLIFDIELLSFY